MAEQTSQGPMDYDGLAAYLAALGYGVRLELLDKLRFPHQLTDLKVPPRRVEPGGNPQRPAAKQSVQRHLERLLDAGLVRVEEVRVGGKKVPRYETNPQKLYAISEELRRITVRYAGRGAGPDATATLEHATAAEEAEGPRFTLVHGVYEGKSFPLTKETAWEGRWLIGRAPRLAVSLDYDPYISVENAALASEGGAFVLHDLRSKNGTSVNWARLPKGGSRRLRSGDIVGVGRSLLCFLPE